MSAKKAVKKQSSKYTGIVVVEIRSGGKVYPVGSKYTASCEEAYQYLININKIKAL